MLTIKRPTATTVLYTVSTRAPAKTFAARFSTVLSILVRVLAALAVTLVLLKEYETAFPSLAFHSALTAGKEAKLSGTLAQPYVTTTTGLLRNDGNLNGSMIAEAGSSIVNGTDGITVSTSTNGDNGDNNGNDEDILNGITPYSLWQDSLLFRLALCAATTYLVARKGYREETLLVMRGLGVQTSTSSSTYLWPRSTARFIPTSAIQDLFIHEAFRGFEVRFYLGIVVEGEEGVVGVFPSILPRREILEVVWRGAKACLYEPQT